MAQNVPLCFGPLEPCASVESTDRRQWICILPKGTIKPRDGRGPWRLERPHQVIANTRRYHGQHNMLVDYEHQSIHSEKNGQPAPAAGWIVGLEALDGAIWAWVEWTEKAQAHIAAREYRYVSPVLRMNSKGFVHLIVNVALVGNAAINTLPSLAKAELKMFDTIDQDAVLQTPEIVDIRKILDLPDDTDLKTLIAAIKSAITEKNGSNPDPAKFVPIGDFEKAVQEANSLRQGISETAATQHVDQLISAGQVAPFLKDWAQQLCSVNKPALDAFVERTGPAFSSILSPQLGSGNFSPGTGDGQLSETDLEVCSTLGVSKDEYISTRQDNDT
ncbi:phage protease [Roseibium album]|uniref:phage protease n=1 Tax=Roseibium album TaxID=311410 RepID=UPI0024917D08|nr:phage protease [Roseibium album]